MLELVSPDELDSDSCSICYESYSAATSSNGTNHKASRMMTCGHIFGRACIALWLEENDTCTICRDAISFPSSYTFRKVHVSYLTPGGLFNDERLENSKVSEWCEYPGLD